MIIVCFIYFDNSLFWPLYGYIPNAKTSLFSYVRMKNSNFKSEIIKEKIIVLSSILCLKLFVYLGSRSDIFNGLSAYQSCYYDVNPLVAL